MRKIRLICLVLGAGILLAAVLAVNLCGSAAPTPEVIALDVGEGSATLIRTEAGCILIDAGPEDSQNRLCERLYRLGVRSLALVIFTHPDEDHIGGGDGILRRFPTEEIWTNGEAADSDSYAALLRAAKTVPVRAVTAGERRTVGEASVTVLSPDAGLAGSENENSLVLSVELAGHRLLIMGDAGEETENRLLNLTAGTDSLRADILFAGHHGANGSCGAEFLAAVAPEQIIISCGAENPYGHPDGRALERMRAVCGDIRRTDLAGDIHLDFSE